MLLNSLTLSETKDNGAGSLENTAGNAPAPQDFYNLEGDFGLGAYHQPYNNTTSIVYDLPFGTGQRFMGNASPVLDLLVGGWQVAVINSFYAGQTVTLTYTPATAFLVSGIQQDFRGANNYRPNVTGEVITPSDQRTVNNWFNRAAVTIPTDPSQPFGNAPRNGYRGPAIVQTDFAASKRFQMPWRNGGLEFRAEVFNLFNRDNFLPPNGNISAAGFGTITSTMDPRIVQFGLKATF
jgi:hypothetical protein